jgi:hypothetical protein
MEHKLETMREKSIQCFIKYIGATQSRNSTAIEYYITKLKDMLPEPEMQILLCDQGYIYSPGPSGCWFATPKTEKAAKEWWLKEGQYKFQS